MAVRIAIIGAGPSGMSQLHAFETARRAGVQNLPEIVCFEKQSNWGGLWNYSWRTGLDEHGEPVHGSMYRFLWSNGPKECHEFADYSFAQHLNRSIPSFPPREILYDYITGRAEKSGIRKYIQFNTVVRWVTYSEATNKFTVTVNKLCDDETQTEEFDYVIVASGHFSTPNVPVFNGIDTFPGRVLHSHDFRDAREFSNKRLLVVGSSYSAEDIGLQCYKYGAKSVTFSYRTKPMGFTWPQSLREVPLITKIKGPRVHFKNGTDEEVDAIIFCTGYLHYFPFLHDSLRLRTTNRLSPPGLYKGVFKTNLPQLIYLGMQDQFYSFTMFDAQAWYVRDVILGKIKLPLVRERELAVTMMCILEESFLDPINEGINFQSEYIKELLKETDCTHGDLDKTAAYFKSWEQDKMRNILTYRNVSFTSVVTGSPSPIHHTEWMKALDDSTETFLKSS